MIYLGIGIIIGLLLGFGICFVWMIPTRFM